MSIFIVFFIYLFGAKRDGVATFMGYTKVIVMFGIVFVIVHLIISFIIWKMKNVKQKK
ncbi:hypothetical protein [Oceanobacillus caeni]|uniref:hypothetical protein n=1 Tax=Oceanobacillus caeni TaxID=405946 RepID=UPI0036D2A2A5